MDEAARPGIATHYLRYTVGNVLVMLAGFVSFPIMTRLLSNTEYGVFGYVDTWLLILTGVFKLGAQHAIIRFYPHRGGVNALGRFGANFVLLPLLCSIGFWLLACVGYGLWTWAHPLSRPVIGWLCLAVLLPTIWISFVTAVLTAEERSDLSVRQFETEGPQAVVRTKRVLLHVLVYIVVAMCVCLIVVGPDALLLLAGPDKAASAPVFVLIGINYALDGLFGICFAGLLLYKRSGLVLSMTMAATVLNVLLNLIWIPAYGVMGAVYATFASFILLTVLHYITCPRELRLWPDRNATLIACALGLAVWLVADATAMFGLTSHFERLLAMGTLMLVLFVAPALALDRPLRETVQNWLHNRFA
jgi:O-antigen/teichoic acid export membrane protein